ncbi:conserved protein of unknown function [Kyrpidia spormannii]|uniref:Uncharacterized protein n=1 Tax=Kyrpidia spormannii TaxID=2055160 RepID=A0ACA8ZD12_9BACL|nr:conserved protein of unknown function [Kyrpidia spormannii]
MKASRVRSVPMRNGNEMSTRVKRGSVLIVRSVPMRNGNGAGGLVPRRGPGVRSVPMRNGNPHVCRIGQSVLPCS